MKQDPLFLFSLAISPDADNIASVRDLKNRLQKRLKRNYGSVNSLAHITLFTFWATMDDYLLILKEFGRIIAGLKPFEITLFGFGFFPPNPLSTFYIKPEQSSCEKIIYCCSKIDTHFRKHLKKVRSKDWRNRAQKEPHMSVGRELLDSEIPECNVLTNEGFVNSFLCNSFVIRKFNKSKGQYDIINTIPLLGYEYIEGQQLMLFDK